MGGVDFRRGFHIYYINKPRIVINPFSFRGTGSRVCVRWSRLDILLSFLYSVYCRLEIYLKIIVFMEGVGLSPSCYRVPVYVQVVSRSGCCCEYLGCSLLSVYYYIHILIYIIIFTMHLSRVDAWFALQGCYYSINSRY